MLLLSSFIVSLFITILLIPPLIKWAVKMQIVDIPDERKVHTGMIPRIGGLAMVLGSIASILLCCFFDLTILSYVIGALVILIFGLLDDRFDLNYKVKFLGQIIAIFFPVVLGGIQITALPFIPFELSPYLAVPFTVFVLLGVTNAINLSDGLDGLAGGTSLLALGLIALLAYLSESMEVMLIALAVIGSTLGFLRYNTYPAQVFMGDSGSQFLGFSVGILAIWVTQVVNQALSPVLPLLILGLPILDTLMVMGQRIKEGRSPFSPDKNHIHHRFLFMGLHHYEAVFAIYVIQSSLILAAYLIRYQSDLLILMIFLSFGLAVISFFIIGEKKGKVFRNGEVGQEGRRQKSRYAFKTSKRIGKFLSSIFENDYLGKSGYLGVAFLLPLYVISGLFFTGVVSTDITWLSMGLVAVLLMTIKLAPTAGTMSFLERACIYTAIAIFVYLFESAGIQQQESQWLMKAMLVALIIAIVLCVAFAKGRHFDPTPLDFLVVFIAIASPQLPLLQGQLNIGLILFKIVVLFYGVELIIAHYQKHMGYLRFMLVLSLGLVGAKGMLIL